MSTKESLNAQLTETVKSAGIADLPESERMDALKNVVEQFRSEHQAEFVNLAQNDELSMDELEQVAGGSWSDITKDVINVFADGAKDIFDAAGIILEEL